jgi:hypothetical protein
MPVPQTAHFPRTAGRPFFMVTCSGFLISRFCLHLTQYPSSAIVPSVFGSLQARLACNQIWIECIIYA